MTVPATDTMSHLHQAARWYASRGAHVFPCWWANSGRCACPDPDCRDLGNGDKGGSPAKHPITPRGFHDATCDPNQVDRWWNEHPQANIGIDLGRSGLFALDVDGPTGAATLTNLEDTYSPLPNTYQVITGRAEGSGRHHIFRQPDGTPVSNRKIGVDLETRGAGGYVIAPPSIHASGRAYLAEGSWDQITDAPGWLIHLTREPRPAPAAAPTAPTSNSGRLAGLAGKVAIAPEGNRNDALNWAAYTAGQAAAAGNLDLDEARTLLGEAGRRAGLTENEVKATLESGFTAGAQHPEPARPSDTGWDLPDVTVLDEAPAVGTDERAEQIRALARNGVDFLNATRGPIPAIWGAADEVLWSEGEGLLVAGGPGVGKTTLVQQVVAGLIGLDGCQQVLGHHVHGPRKVLYLALDRPRQIGRALGRLLDPEQHRSELGRLTVWDQPLPFRPEAGRSNLTEFASLLGAEVVVIDSMYDLSPGIVKPEVAGEVVAGIKQMVNAGIDVVGIHHARKQPTQGRNRPSLDELYGGMQLGAGFGSVLWLKGSAGDTSVSLLHLKQPGEVVGPYTLEHDHKQGVTNVRQGVDLLAVAIAQGRIDVPTAAVLMAEDPSPDRAAKERARRRLEQLEKAGKLRVVASGDGVLKVWEPAGDDVTVLDPEVI